MRVQRILFCILFCAIFTGCAYNTAYSNIVTEKKESKKETKKEKESKNLKKEEMEKKKEEEETKIAYEDALYGIMKKYKNSQDQFAENTVDSYTFIDVDNDTEKEVIFYTNYTNKDRLNISERKIDDSYFMLFDYSKKNGFQLKYKIILPDDSIQKNGIEDMITELDIAGIENEKTKQKNYYLSIYKEWIEKDSLSKGEFYGVYKIGIDGLQKVSIRNNFDKYPEETIFYSRNSSGKISMVSEEEYRENLEQQIKGKEIKIQIYNNLHDISMEQPSTAKKELKLKSEKSESILKLSENSENSILARDTNIRKKYYKTEDTEKRGNNLGNLKYFSYVAANDLWTFYRGLGGIYRIPSDSRFQSFSHVIKTDEKCENLNIYEDKLYFTIGNQIYSSNFDGSNQVSLGSGGQVQIYNDWIYFTNFKNGVSSIMKMNLNGNQRQVVCETSAYNLNVVGDEIYFLYQTNLEGADYYWPNGEVYKVNTDGTGLQKVMNGSVCNLIYEDGSFYFLKINQNSVYQANMDFSKISEVITNTNPIEAFNMNQGKFIIYTGGELYNASDMMLIETNVDIRNIFLTDNSIFYLKIEPSTYHLALYCTSSTAIEGSKIDFITNIP